MELFREATAQDAGLISHIYATSWRRAYRGLIAQDYLDRLPEDYWVPSIPFLAGKRPPGGLADL